MPKLPRLSGAEVIKALEQLGFTQVRQRGSHVVLRKEITSVAIGWVVPMHRELATGTLRAILKQAGLTVEQFLNKL